MASGQGMTEKTGCYSSVKKVLFFTVRNQINYILIHDRYRHSIRSVKTFPDADASSDNDPMIARVHIKLKKKHQKE